jgi:hypothetical protein
MIFTFLGKSYLLPENVDINVFKFDDGCIDFDFIINGQEIAMLGGFDIDGRPCPTWEEAGIKILNTTQEER